MAKEIFTLGRDAIDQIRSLIRDERSRIGNPEGHRGRWMQWNRSSVSASHIRFQIVSADQTNHIALCQVMSWTRGSSKANIYGINPLGVLTVCDPAGCFFDAPEEELTGRIGFAQLMDSDEPDNCRSGYQPYDPVWEVYSLCCLTPTCEV